MNRATEFLLKLRHPGPRPLALPAELAPRTEQQAYELQRDIMQALNVRAGGWKASLNDPHSGSCAPVYASDIHSSGAHIHSPIVERFGIEPEVAFSLKQPLPPLPYAGRYRLNEVVAAIGAAHVAIEILISRFSSHESAPVLDRLADNLSNGALIVGPPCIDWQRLDLRTLPLQMVIESEDGHSQMHEARGGHPLQDPLLPLVWLANHFSALGTGLQSGDIITTGSYAGLRYVGRSTHVTVRFEGLGLADCYS